LETSRDFAVLYCCYASFGVCRSFAVNGLPSPTAKLPGIESEHSDLSPVEFKQEWSYKFALYVPPYSSVPLSKGQFYLHLKHMKRLKKHRYEMKLNAMSKQEN
jgi:hypothetical protein